MGFLKNFFGSGNDNRKTEPIVTSEPKRATSVQDLFHINFDDFPNESFSFSRDVNSTGVPYVIAKKNLSYKEVSLFEELKSFVFEDGSRNIFFLSQNYSPSQFHLVKKFLDSLYTILGPDSRGNRSLSFENQQYLQVSGNTFNINVWLTWEADKHYIFSAEIGKEISFHISIGSNATIKERFYATNIELTSNHLLPEREWALNKTEASMEYDEFEKKTSYRITKVAGLPDPYFYSYSLDESFVADLSTLTKLAFTYTFSGDSFYLHVISYDNNFPLDKGDKIFFLFEDDSTIEVEMIIPKVKSNQGSNRNTIPITAEQMRAFATKFLEKWKITSFKNGVYQVGGFSQNAFIQETYKGKREGSFVFRTMARALIMCILEHEKNTLAFDLNS